MSSSAYYQDHLNAIWPNRSFASSVYDGNNNNDTRILYRILNGSNNGVRATRKKEKKYH